MYVLFYYNDCVGVWCNNFLVVYCYVQLLGFGLVGIVHFVASI